MFEEGHDKSMKLARAFGRRTLNVQSIYKLGCVRKFYWSISSRAQPEVRIFNETRHHVLYILKLKWTKLTTVP
jgi:hypothetical protein